MGMIATVTVFVIVVGLIASGPLRTRTLRKLGKLAPGSVRFTVANRRPFVDGLLLASIGTPMGDRAVALTSGPCIAADSSGITIWDNTPLVAVGTLPWHRIKDVTTRDGSGGRWDWPASTILLAIGGPDGDVTLPLLSPNGSGRLLSSQWESRHLAIRLEALRARHSAT